jgi:hypothetical protein
MKILSRGESVHGEWKTVVRKQEAKNLKGNDSNVKNKDNSERGLFAQSKKIKGTKAQVTTPRCAPPSFTIFDIVLSSMKPSPESKHVNDVKAPRNANAAPVTSLTMISSESKPCEFVAKKKKKKLSVMKKRILLVCDYFLVDFSTYSVFNSGKA